MCTHKNLRKYIYQKRKNVRLEREEFSNLRTLTLDTGLNNLSGTPGTNYKTMLG